MKGLLESDYKFLIPENMPSKNFHQVLYKVKKLTIVPRITNDFGHPAQISI